MTAPAANSSTAATDAEFEEKCAFFAKARAGAHRINLGPDHGWQERYVPRLGGKNVRPPSMPERGYEKAQQAIEGAREFKQLCRNALAKSCSDGGS